MIELIDLVAFIIILRNHVLYFLKVLFVLVFHRFDIVNDTYLFSESDLRSFLLSFQSPPRPLQALLLYFFLLYQGFSLLLFLLEVSPFFTNIILLINTFVSNLGLRRSGGAILSTFHNHGDQVFNLNALHYVLPNQ